MIRRREEYLVVLRSPEKGGYWHVVAGRVEPGEDRGKAASREVQEETGLTGAAPTAVGAFHYVREPWEAEPGLAVDVRAFLVEAEPGWEPVLNEEHVEYRWCAAADAAELLFWPEPADLVRRLARQL